VIAKRAHERPELEPIHQRIATIDVIHRNGEDGYSGVDGSSGRDGYHGSGGFHGGKF